MASKKILADLHMCFAGYGGIPQDARTVYAMLAEIKNLQLDGALISNTLLHQDQFEYQKLSFIKKVWILLKFPFLLHQLFKPQCFKPFEQDKSLIWPAVFKKSVNKTHKKNILKGNFYQTKLGFLFLKLTALFSLPLIVFKTDEWDFFLSHVGFPGRVSKKTKMLIRTHDLIPLTHPEFFPDGVVHKRAFQQQLEANIKAAFFICDSSATRKCLIQHYPKTKKRTHVIPCCVSDAFYPSKQLNIVSVLKAYAHGLIQEKKGWVTLPKTNFKSKIGAYFLAVNTFEPRKNYKLLIEMWKKYHSQFTPDTKLVFLANIGWNVEKELAHLAPLLEKESIILLQKVPFEDLRALYSGAIATISPSFIEGFSYAGVESMKCGTPVLASDIAVHREIFQEAPFYFNPNSIDALVQAMKKMRMLTLEERTKRIEMGTQISKQYSWYAVQKNWKDFFDLIQ